uniref:Uncharacterized protein n=1 Tax=Knipowitschia caucasica TaxID=637954 RepID=A0AAV2KPT4_KNICA
MQMSNNSSLLQCNNIGSYVAFTSWIAVYLHIFPTFISVTFFAFRKWKWHRSTITHSDVFTFHMVVMELLNLVGSGLSFVRLMWRPNLSESGIGLKYFASIGVMWLHILTCVERYMAVVHPITYLRLKKRGGVTIRNISLGWAWSSTHARASPSVSGSTPSSLNDLFVPPSPVPDRSRKSARLASQDAGSVRTFLAARGVVPEDALVLTVLWPHTSADWCYDVGVDEEEPIQPKLNFTASLDPPTLSLSVTVGVSQAQGQAVRVLLGSQFMVQCSVNPQYPEGSFMLPSPSGNRILPSVNHTGFSHKGKYTCVFFHYSSSASESLQISLGGKGQKGH